MKSSQFGERLFLNSLPTKFPFQDSLLIFDRVLLKKHGTWIRKFPRRLGFKSGEALKDLKLFPARMEKILDLSTGIPRQELSIVAFGGGSLGDFAGFVASVLKRGTNLVQFPSTWLAAMDSSHGGKTALNIGKFKNQIGSFKFPIQTILVKSVLNQVPQKQIDSALGEFYKMALIEGWRPSNPGAHELWQLLPKVIHGKMKIVSKDPFETKGQRHILNLGHTVGHVLEGELGLAHGEAVLLGLRFAWVWSQHRGVCKLKAVPEFLPSHGELKAALKKVKSPSVAFLQDKKILSDNKIQFIFIRRPGKVIVEKVSLSDLLSEWRRQCQ